MIFCEHYGRCGGCTLQHLSDVEHDAHKSALLLQTLQEQGIATDVLPLIRVNGARRRTGLALYRKGAQVVVGYKQARSLVIEPVARCPVLTPALQRAQAQVAAVFGPLVPDETRLSLFLTDADNGIDAHLTGRKPPVGGDLTALLRRCADMPGLLRLSMGSDTVYAVDTPRVDCSGTAVALPPGGFLQPSREGQAQLTALVLQAVAEATPPQKPKTTARQKTGKSVLDLFCGIGPYAIALEKAGHRVQAFEADSAACDALRTASGGRVMVESRDLYRHPVLGFAGRAFAGVDVIVLNPPRQGAEAQMRALCDVRPAVRLVYVSCNLDTLARDAALAIRAGYALRTLQLVDQFVYTDHLEAVAIFDPISNTSA